MPAAIHVEEPGDPRLADYVALTDVELRRRREPAEGLFVAEGEKVIRRAVAADYPMRSCLLEDRWLPALEDLLASVDAPVYVASRELLEAVTGYVVHRGALAAMARKPLPTAEELTAGANRLAVLEMNCARSFRAREVEDPMAGRRRVKPKQFTGRDRMTTTREPRCC